MERLDGNPVSGAFGLLPVIISFVVENQLLLAEKPINSRFVLFVSVVRKLTDRLLGATQKSINIPIT